MTTTIREQLTEKFWLAHRAGLSTEANRLLRLMEKLDAKEATMASTEDRIIATIESLAELPGDLVSLARVRAAIADVDHAEMTRVLKAMDRARVIQLDPDPNRKALSQVAIDAAVEIGGEPKHLVSLI